MSEINRRDFLKVVGVTGAASAVACDPRVPIENVLPYVVQPAQIVPGVPTFFSTQCNECSKNCGVIARNREGRVVKIDGNPDHPVSQGSICAVGLAGIQSTYSPDRITGPKAGATDSSWSATLASVGESLQEGRVAWIGYPRSGATGALVRSFMSALGYERPLYWDPMGDDALKAATAEVFGIEGRVPNYSLKDAHVVLSFGSDFLATADSPSDERGWADSRDPAYQTPDGESFVGITICVEPRIGVSSAVTDLHLAAKPGSETKLALAMAHALCSSEHGPEYPSGLQAALEAVNIDEAVAEADFLREGFDRTIQHLLDAYEAGHPTVVLPGGPATSSQPTELAKATLLLNHILGNMGRTVVFGPERNLADVGNFADVQQLIQECREGRYDTLIVDEIDLVHVLPESLDVAGALSGVRLVAFSNEQNETVNQTIIGEGFVLPPGSGLETWGDGEAYRGLHTIQQPGMIPLLDTRSVGQTLLTLGGLKGLDLAGDAEWMQPFQRAFEQCEADFSDWVDRIGGLRDNLDTVQANEADPDADIEALDEDALAEAVAAAQQQLDDAIAEHPDWDVESTPCEAVVTSELWVDYIKSYWQHVVQPASGSTTDFTAFWIECLQRGCVDARPSVEEVAFGMTGLPAVGEVASGMSLVLFHHPYLMDGRHANKPWLQESPEPISSNSWGTWIEVNPSVAEQNGFEPGKTVRVTSGDTSMDVAWFGSPAIRTDTVALVMGNGHNFGRYATVGGADNPMKMIDAVTDDGGALSYVSTNDIRITAVGDETTVSAYIGNIDQDGRGINFTVSKDDLGTGDGPGSIVPMHHFPVDSRLREHFGTNSVGEPVMDMFPEPDHPTYRFAMAIDLNRCNGCNACAVACVAENNIPVVGPDQMKLSRYMGWMRLSRYFEGEGLEPDVRFQPVSCQQCSHAPCEGVCPVLATYHNLDGLNAMVYNRCVGTRYCANNCPYTARRFNFHSYQWPDSYNLMLNPDIVTREMGVMEKCTFCIHKIREAKDLYRDETYAARTDDGPVDVIPVPEEHLQKLPACGAACPTGAVTFGNLKNERQGEQYRGDVFWKFQDERAYAMLGELNTKPGVRYLARITHGASQLHHGGGHGDGHGDDHGDGHGDGHDDGHGQDASNGHH